MKDMLDHGLTEATGPVPASFVGIGDLLHSSMAVQAITDLLATGNSQRQSSRHYVALRQKWHGFS